MMFANTLSAGAFPPLLPELASSGGLSDLQLGAVVGAFGFARMLADIPVGLFLGGRLKLGLALGPVVLALGIACVGSGGPLAVLLIGRALLGIGHALGMVACLTAILRYHAGPWLGAALNSVELSAMLGILVGVVLLGALPGALAWNVALLLACAPQLIGIAILPWLIGSIPTSRARAGPLESRSRGPSGTPAPHPWLIPLAFGTGTLVSIAYSTIEGFLLPLRASRDFGLGRAGIARLLLIAQLCDIVALLPVGIASDRRGPIRVLGYVALTMALATAFIAFGTLPMMALGAALLGLAMAGWMVPLSVLRLATAPDQVAWRTALYRVGVDGGIFLGPFLAGLLGARYWRWLPAIIAALLTVVGVGVLFARTESARPGAE
jgi:MFS family permease